MVKVTLDHNCILAIENSELEAECLSSIVTMHNGQDFDVAVLGISASERMLGGGYLSSIDEFLQRLEPIGMKHLQILKPTGVWDLTFWDWSIYSSDADQDLQNSIHEVLFPNIDRQWAQFAAAFGEDVNSRIGPGYRKWRNRLCDVQGLWAHIKNDRDIFVTSDKNFLNKTSELIRLGSEAILTPVQLKARF
jgi:hypothetical protein